MHTHLALKPCRLVQSFWAACCCCLGLEHTQTHIHTHTHARTTTCASRSMQMPGKHEHVIKCRLSKRQRTLYEEYMAASEVSALPWECCARGHQGGVVNELWFCQGRAMA